MSNPIIFTITDAGLNAALDAENNGINLNLNQLKLGTGKYTPSAATTAMTGVWGTFDIAAGDVNAAAKTLSLSTVASSSTKQDVFEIGVFTSTNVLFAVASITGSEPFFTVFPNIDFIGSFGLALGQISASNITVSVDPNAALALSIFNQHIAASNPHPQYMLTANFSNYFSSIAENLWPVGSWHGSSDPSYDPENRLNSSFGYLTKWRKLPYIPRGVSRSSELNSINTISSSDSTFQSIGTYIWQRMPNNYVAPSAKIYWGRTNLFSGLTLGVQKFFHPNFFAVGTCFYVIDVRNVDSLPMNYKMRGGLSVNKGSPIQKRPSELFSSDVAGQVYADDSGFILIPVTLSYGLNSSSTRHSNIDLELDINHQYQVTFDPSDRYLEARDNGTNRTPLNLHINKKHVRTGDMQVITVRRMADFATASDVEIHFFYLDASVGSSGLPNLNAIQYTIGGDVEFLSDPAITKIEPNKYKVAFAANEQEKQLSFVVKSTLRPTRRTILASAKLPQFNYEVVETFTLEREQPQPTYSLNHSTFTNKITIQLNVTLFTVGESVAWHIQGLNGDELMPNNLTGVLVIDASGTAEIEFTIQQWPRELNFVFRLTDHDEYVVISTL